LANSGDKDHILIAVVLGVYTSVLFKGVFAYAEQLRTRVLMQIDTENRARTRMRNIQATGLNAMGGMASGLAHEINQPLSACGAYLATARRLAAMRPEARPASIEEVLDSAVEQNLRAGEIVKNLRDFIMRGEPNRIHLSLHNLIGDALHVATTVEGEGSCEISLQFDAKSDRIFADKVQIKQVLVNLIRNAVEAMSVSTERKLTISSSIIDDGSIRIDVADTGNGLAEALKSELFEPFMTTKTDGMGIGLAICRATVEAHEGTIWTESNPGGGAVFSFALPLAKEESGV
jgi:two-component system CheB/CheR fusion protein